MRQFSDQRHCVFNERIGHTVAVGVDMVEKPTEFDPIISESSNSLSNLRGTIAMARTLDPDSARAQFFINLKDNTPTGDGATNLDYGAIAYDNIPEPYIKVGYCVFGEVLSGMDVVDAIAAVTTHTENDMDDVPVDDVIIERATITQSVPVCAEKMQGDVNGDCTVNLEDFAKLAENWLECNSITAICN
ncbi:MAG: peptidylprolyl isomerase [Planctomycetota bacterium]